MSTEEGGSTMVLVDVEVHERDHRQVKKIGHIHRRELAFFLGSSVTVELTLQWQRQRIEAVELFGRNESIEFRGEYIQFVGVTEEDLSAQNVRMNDLMIYTGMPGEFPWVVRISTESMMSVLGTDSLVTLQLLIDEESSQILAVKLGSDQGSVRVFRAGRSLFLENQYFNEQGEILLTQREPLRPSMNRSK